MADWLVEMSVVQWVFLMAGYLVGVWADSMAVVMAALWVVSMVVSKVDSTVVAMAGLTAGLMAD